MNIKLIKLSEKKLDKNIIRNDEFLINEINDSLFDDDIVLTIDPSEYVYPVLLIESDNVLTAFKAIQEQLINPVIILPGTGDKALKGALEVNTRLLMDNYHPIVVKGSDNDASTIIREVCKVIIAKDKINNSNIALIGDYSKKDVINKTDIGNISQKHKVNVIKIGNSEIDEVVDKAKIISLPHKALFNKIFNDKNELNEFTRFYSGMMTLVNKYHLSGICFNNDKYDNQYLLASLLNEKGVSFILDNDLNGLLSLMLLNALNDSVAIYGFVKDVDLEKNDVTLISHNVPLTLLNKEGGINGGDITILKFGYDNKRFLAINGKIISSKAEDEVMIIIHLEDREMFDLLKEPVGGTFAFCYGDSLANIFAYDNIVFFDNKK